MYNSLKIQGLLFISMHENELDDDTNISWDAFNVTYSSHIKLGKIIQPT